MENGFRSKDTLMEFEDVTLLLQYLYMDESHAVQYKNSMGTPIEMRMDGDCGLKFRNLNFLAVPEHEDTVSPNTLLAIVEYLKEAPPKGDIAKTDRFKTRWDEVSAVTKMNLSLNRPGA